MKRVELEQKLIAAAKAHPPSDHVPYAFERRIMARLETVRLPDSWSAWARVWWRAAAPCLAIALGLGAWTLSIGGLGDPASLNTDLETTAFAALETPGGSW